MNDLISRAEAIDAIYHHLPSVSRTRARTMLHEVPSAQPEIIHCRDCKWKNRHNCTRAVEVWIDDDKFCAWGERRTDGEQSD